MSGAITAERLRDLLIYEPETGIFRRRYYRGVSWRNDKRKWKAYINRNDKQFHLGYFDSKEDAYAAYKSAAIAHFGEFARV